MAGKDDGLVLMMVVLLLLLWLATRKSDRDDHQSQSVSQPVHSIMEAVLVINWSVGFGYWDSERDISCSSWPLLQVLATCYPSEVQMCTPFQSVPSTCTTALAKERPFPLGSLWPG